MKCLFLSKNLIFLHFSLQPLAVIGGVLALALSSNAFWSFVYWSHAITASIIVALNVFNIMPALEKKFALMPKVVSIIN